MDIFLILLLIIAVFSFNDLVPVYKNKQWKVFWIYVTIMVFHLFVSILIRLNVTIPSPATPLENLVRSIFGQNEKL